MQMEAQSAPSDGAANAAPATASLYRSVRAATTAHAVATIER